MEIQSNKLDNELFLFYQRNMNIYSEKLYQMIDGVMTGQSEFWEKSIVERVLRDSMAWPDNDSQEGISITHGSVERSKDNYINGFILNVLNIRRTIPNLPDNKGGINYLDEVHPDDFIKSY